MKRSTDSPDVVAGTISPKRRRPTVPQEFNLKDVAKSGCIGNGDTISSSDGNPKSKKANVRKERNESMESTVSMTTFIENNLSEKAKHALLRLEKNKTQDPFNEENQLLVSEFTTQVTQQAEKDVNLAEAGVLLDGVAQVYSRQVKRLHSDVLALAAFCATTPKPKPKDLNKDSAVVKDPNDTANLDTTNTPAPAGDVSVPHRDVCDGNMSMDTDPLKLNEDGTADGNIEIVPGSSEASAANSAQDGNSTNADNDALPENHVPTEEEQNLFLQGLVLDGVNPTNIDGDSENKIQPDFNSENLVTSTPTKENPDRVGPSAGTRGAKKCYSIKDLLQDQSFFKALGIALNAKGDPKLGNPRGVKVPKLTPFYKIPFVDAEDLGPPCLESSIVPDYKEIGKNEIITDINKNYVLNMGTPEPPLSLPSMVPEGVLYEAGKGKEDSLIKPEDLTSIHKFIQQLHYLSLNTEVSAERKEGLFKNAVGELHKIFETYNVTQTGAPTLSDSDAGHPDEAATSAGPTQEGGQTLNPVLSSNNDTRTSIDSVPESNRAASPASTPCPGSRKPSTEEDCDDLHLDLESMHESFSESCDDNSTVMQRTKEKSRKESRHRLQEVLSTILSPIVKKHSIKPLMEEHTEAFFRKVESFQSKMKKILEEEKRKDQFNLTTYEQELLEVANKDMDSDDGSQVPNPVTNTLHDSNETDAKDFPEPQSPCRSETSSNSNGLKWIKLENLFAHVKHQDRREAARYFCAVLGLLSFENFDVNYDKLYDEASAKKVKKVHDRTQDTKYPRGAKIVKSRCPDVNEVFVTALSSVSRTETFRQKEYGLSPEDIKKMHQAEFLEATGAQAAFEQVQGEIFTGELFSKRSRAMQARKLVKAQLQAGKNASSPSAEVIQPVPGRTGEAEQRTITN